MENLARHLRKFGMLLIGIIIYVFLVHQFAGSAVSMVLLLGGWIAFVGLFIKFIADIFRPVKRNSSSVPANTANTQTQTTTQQYYREPGGNYTPAQSANNPIATTNKTTHTVRPWQDGINSRYVIYLVCLIFIGILYTTPLTGYMLLHPLAIANSFGGWLWWICVLCFIVGFMGMRKTEDVIVRYTDGSTARGVKDKGAVTGTDGLKGGFALTIAYISVYMIWTMIAHWGYQKPFPNNKDTFVPIMVIIGSLFIIPLYFGFILMITSKNKMVWIIGTAWLLFLLIVSRM